MRSEALRELADGWEAEGNVRSQSELLRAARSTFRECAESLRAALAVPEGEPDDADWNPEFTAWLVAQMPSGTHIHDPLWWSPRIMRAARYFMASRPTEATP